MLLPASHKAGYQAVLDRCTEWVRGSGWALVLTGVPGCGKTAIASSLVASEWRQAGFLDTGRFTDAVREGQTVGSYMRRADLFVLDDVGGEYATYFSNTVVDRFVAECYAQRTRLVVTTNMSEAQLAEFYSARLVDRLMEDSVWLSVPSYSFRRKVVVDG